MVLPDRPHLLVTFGVKPTRAETGYGYIQAGAPLERGNRVARFVEKPKREVAETYVASGEFLWNSGIFMMTAGRWLEEIGRHRPDIAQVCDANLADQGAGHGFCPHCQRGVRALPE